MKWLIAWLVPRGYLNQCWLLNCTLWNKFSEIWSKIPFHKRKEIGSVISLVFAILFMSQIQCVKLNLNWYTENRSKSTNKCRHASEINIHRKTTAVIMPTLLSLMAAQVVIMTTFGVPVMTKLTAWQPSISSVWVGKKSVQCILQHANMEITLKLLFSLTHFYHFSILGSYRYLKSPLVKDIFYPIWPTP